ncbi:MAG TPA: hypothetical protein VFF44_12800 [Casimicrobiaceae bacterium]|nr:hypothetical protein [Casimicrobiaceae bacterium]
MNQSLARLAARKQVLIAELELQRMQMRVHASDARNALRPSGMLGGAIARPAAAMALVDAIARLFGWHRLARVVRFGALALAAYRIARVWRTRVPSSPHPSL